MTMNTEDIASYKFLKTLSGAKTPQAVISWLSKERIKYWPDVKGRPVTIKQNLTGSSKKTETKTSKLKLINGQKEK